MNDTSELVSNASGAIKASPTQTIQDTLDNFLSTASSEAVYHEPVKHGNTLLIPAAEIVSVMGFGLGSGETGEAGVVSDGGGGGGGGSVFSRPVAVIISSPDGVRVEPVLDLTKIALAGMTTGVLVLGMIGRLFSLRHKIQNVQDEFMKII